MSILEATILGIVQGLTEFLPVSSSGHLVLVHSFFGFIEQGIFFDICLHVGTLVAVILYFGKDIIRLIRERNVLWLFCVIIGTIPAVFAALLFEDRISAFFVSPRKAAFMLLVTGFVLFAAQLSLRKEPGAGRGPTLLKSFFVGVAQAFALLPGISRSGMTISAGLFGRMSAENAFRFSFLLSIPAILGALLYKMLKADMGQIVANELGAYLAGIAAALVTGLLSLFLLWKVLRTRCLYVFGIYCLLLGITGILFLK